MAVRTKELIDNGISQRGVLVTEKNMASVALWAHGDIVHTIRGDRKPVDPRIRFKPEGKGWRVARPGDIMVKVDSLCFYVIKANEFDNKKVRWVK